MTIGRVNPGGWGANAKLTSAQMNAVDTNATYALDKRAGQSDTCQSTLTFNGGMTFNASSLFNGSATFSGGLTCNSTALFSGPATFTTTTSLQGATTASNFTMSGTTNVQLASRSILRVVGGLWVPDPALGAWVFTGTSSLATSSTSQSYVRLGFTLPVACTITQVRVWIQPNTGHSLLPANMPEALFQYTVPSTGTAALFAGGTAFDASGSVGAYEAVHALTITGSWTYDRTTTRVNLALVSEYGTNAVAGLKIHGADVTFTPTSYDDGATS